MSLTFQLPFDVSPPCPRFGRILGGNKTAFACAARAGQHVLYAHFPPPAWLVPVEMGGRESEGARLGHTLWIKSEERTLPPRLPPSSRRSLLSCRCARGQPARARRLRRPSPRKCLMCHGDVCAVALGTAEDERAQIWAPDLVECSTRTQKSCVTLHLTTKPV